ncbi:PPK2 family polyphosphate kinase [Microbacterium sp. B2969]|uniref:PPK2 family polyphosphate kinase n=1 Tax=Microbacterium alkaliflavum TaxID=3248839 RepID=A0ABW7Q288_9MICO
MTAKSQKNWTGDPSELLRVGEGFRLADVDPSSTPGYEGGKKDGQEDLDDGAAELDELQERLYAESRTEASNAAVLLVLQAMDSAGKGGILRHVVGSVDPQGITLTAFKKPTKAELSHDFLWRIEKRVPQPGYIGVFDRSQYEDVLIARVRGLAEPAEIERRYGAINDFEKKLSDTGTRVLKVMLHISSDEQRDRLMRRLDRPDKHWKFNPGDTDERLLWPKYMDAYQVAFERTSTPWAPWYVVPANHKWYTRLAVQALLLETLERVDPQWPAATYDVEAEKARLAAS